jgi:hypothetical protein
VCRMTDTIANQSPDQDHATAHNGSSVNQFRFGDSKAGYVMAALLGVSVIVNVYACWVISGYTKEQRLKQYDLDWFKSADFAQLKGQVEMHDKMINVLLIRRECMK